MAPFLITRHPNRADAKHNNWPSLIWALHGAPCSLTVCLQRLPVFTVNLGRVLPFA